MKLKTRKKLTTILKIVATIFVIPLVFSTFFSGYTVLSVGPQVNTPVSVSIFEFPAAKEFVLALAFVSIVLETVLVIFMIFFGISQTMRKTQDALIGVMTAVFQIILAIMQFVMMVIFCKTNSVIGLTYSLGVCPIMYFVCGLLFGGFMIASYLVPTKTKPRQSAVNNVTSA